MEMKKMSISKIPVSIEQLINTANQEMLRLAYSSSRIWLHCKELREFAKYCEENAICFYAFNTGIAYFSHRYGLDVTDPTIKLNTKQRNTRNTIRFLDDIYQFGYARRYSHHDYNVPLEYTGLLDDYFGYCIQNNCAASTIRVKRTKLLQFLCFLMGRGMASWAIRFASSLREVEVVLSGMNTLEQVQDNMRPMKPLNEEEQAVLKKTAQIIRSHTAIPCTGCKYCASNCPMQIPIPSYFALFNDYSRSPGEGWKMQNVYDDAIQIGGKASACIACRQCENNCPQGIRITEYLPLVAEAFER